MGAYSQGEVHVFDQGYTKGSNVIPVFGPGSFFGEIALIMDCHRSASIR